MFDFAWSEIAVIGVVALIAIGPKDMPAAIKSVTDMIKKARRMASEFQGHVDEMVREANLHDVRKQINEIRNFDFKGEIERNVDPDGSLRSTFASNPLASAATPSAAGSQTAPEAVTVADQAVKELERPGDADAIAHEAGAAQVDQITAAPKTDEAPTTDEGPTTEAEATGEIQSAPAFIPPAFATKPEPPPAFVPPGVVRSRSAALRPW
jgi:sec-independent protein translocase protein TatB